MTTNELPYRWAEQCGLALAPLFEMEEAIVPGSHHVLLDGGFGSFALSVSTDELWREANPANWAWSSDLPHHVTTLLRDRISGRRRSQRVTATALSVTGTKRVCQA